MGVAVWTLCKSSAFCFKLSSKKFCNRNPRHSEVLALYCRNAATANWAKCLMASPPGSVEDMVCIYSTSTDQSRFGWPVRERGGDKRGWQVSGGWQVTGTHQGVEKSDDGCPFPRHPPCQLPHLKLWCAFKSPIGKTTQVCHSVMNRFKVVIFTQNILEKSQGFSDCWAHSSVHSPFLVQFCERRVDNNFCDFFSPYMQTTELFGTRQDSTVSDSSVLFPDWGASLRCVCVRVRVCLHKRTRTHTHT